MDYTKTEILNVVEFNGIQKPISNAVTDILYLKMKGSEISKSIKNQIEGDSEQ